MGSAIQAAVEEDHVGLKSLGFVHSHHLHGIGVTLQTLQTALVARGQTRTIDIRTQGLDQLSQAGVRARRLFLQDLKNVQGVGQGALALAEANFATHNPALREHARGESAKVPR